MATVNEELLRLIAQAVRTSSGTGGTQLLGVGTHTGGFSAVSVARAGTTITAMVATNQTESTDTLDLTHFNPDAVALEKGDLFVAPSGYKITSVTVGAGAISVAK